VRAVPLDPPAGKPLATLLSHRRVLAPPDTGHLSHYFVVQVHLVRSLKDPCLPTDWLSVIRIGVLVLLQCRRSLLVEQGVTKFLLVCTERFILPSCTAARATDPEVSLSKMVRHHFLGISLHEDRS
jgi:hypothetical protein